MADPWESFISGVVESQSAPPNGSGPVSAGEAKDAGLRGWDFVLSSALSPGRVQSVTRSTREKVSPERIISGLVERGLPQHVAEGFALNIRDESGFDPGINEINPVVPGSRGGFGLIQFTGPRRDALEDLAAQRGVPPSDVDLQLDNIVREFFGPEKRAGARILATGNTAEAAAAIVSEFLRPTEENRIRRVRKYMSLGGGET